MKEYKSTSRLLSNYNPMSTIKRKELIAQLEQDMKNHPISERRFKEEKCKALTIVNGLVLKKTLFYLYF